jgi:hypothetical protein
MHVIHLRRPWERLSKTERQPVVVDVPDVSDLNGTTMSSGDLVKYRRGFNAPTGLTAGETMGLYIGAWQGRLVSVQINETLAAAANAPLVLDLSNSLAGFNKIEIVLMSEFGELPRITGDVLLQIREMSE